METIAETEKDKMTLDPLLYEEGRAEESVLGWYFSHSLSPLLQQ